MSKPLFLVVFAGQNAGARGGLQAAEELVKAMEECVADGYAVPRAPTVFGEFLILPLRDPAEWDDRMSELQARKGEGPE